MVAYELYKNIIAQDVKSKFVTIPVLKMSRQPETAFENVTEKQDALDPD